MASASPQKQLSAFIAKYDPKVARIGQAALAKLRKRLPGAVELVYDNYNALAIGFGPSERTSEAVFSLALWPRWVSLFFLQGAGLADPHGLLKGSGRKARHIVLTEASDLDAPVVQKLIEAALDGAARPIDPKGRRKLVIKSVSARQRPRRAV